MNPNGIFPATESPQSIEPSGLFPYFLSEKKFDWTKSPALTYNEWLERMGDTGDGHSTENDFRLLRSFDNYDEYLSFVKAKLAEMSQH